MKRLFNIFLASLLCALTASAAGPHRIRVKALPEGAITVYVHFDGDVNERGWSVDRYCSDTLAVFEDFAEPGTQIHIRPSCPTGYVLKQWTENGIPWTYPGHPDWFKYYNDVYYTMPDEDVEIIGIFEYNPEAPTYQPATGNWDPETGTLICDNGEGSYPAGFNYNEDKEKVITYIVGGTSGGYNNQYSLYSDYPNIVTLDLSRTSINRLYINGEREALKEVILPSTFNEFGQDAMKAVKLQTLTCFATTPPKLYFYREYDWNTGQYIDKGQRVFYDCPDMVVRVPRESVPLYQAAPGWKDFTILPVDQNYVNLTVKLMDSPNAETLQQYKNMTLQLTNLGTGQVRRLLMSGRNEYEFRYLPLPSNYSLSLQNARGHEAAHVDHIFMGDQSKQVTLTELKSPRNISLTYTADGKPVAEADLSTTWLNNSREYLTRGKKLEEVFDGQQLLCTTTLSAELASIYQQPDTLFVTVGAPYDIVIPLQLLQTKNVTFTVIDSLTRKGIDKATIQVVQMLPGGKTGATATLTTAANGIATGEVLAASSLVTATSPMHGSQSRHVNLADSTAARFTFLPANGTCVQVGHTFQPAVPEGQTAQIQSAYADGRSLEYTFTATLPDGRDSIISHYLTNYPLYTFYTQLPEGTRLHVAATSAKGDIEPVEVEAIVGQETTVSVTLPIVERGQVEASYYVTESNKPALIVINKETGQVVRREAFDTNKKTASITALPEGNYLLAAMSQGMQYAAITSQQQLQEYTEGSDYVSEEVTVSNGLVSQTSFSRVPLCTAQLETNLSERRARFGNGFITIGFYAGLSIKVQFDGLKERTWWNRGTYDMDHYPTNCKLEFYVPEGFDRVSAYRSQRIYKLYGGKGYLTIGSMTLDEMEKSGQNYSVQGSEIYQTAADTQWDEAERKLTIDWPGIDQGGTMQLSMTPTIAGDFRPEIYLTYTMDGKQYREMIDSETLTVSRSGIEVPEVVVSPTLYVSGKAMFIDETKDNNAQAAKSRRASNAAAAAWIPPTPPYYEVTVMDGDQPIGQATINSEGNWKTTCTLANATALSKHNIYAKIAYKNGISYQTEAKTVTYDPNAVVPLSIRMSFFNHHPVHLINQEVFFDMVQRKATPSSYGYDNREGVNTDFTFEINLSNNDTTKVYACDLYVQTRGPEAEEFLIPAHYNARKNRWIAYWKFNTNSLPYDVNAIPYYHHEPVGSAEEFRGTLNDYDWLKADASKDALEKQIEQLLNKIEVAVSHNNESELPDMNELISLLNQYSELTGFDPITMGDADVEKPGDEAALMQQIEDLLAEMNGLAEQYGTDIYNLTTDLSQTEISHATGLTRESLIADGYDPIKLDDGSEVFTKVLDDGTWYYVDLQSDLMMKVPGTLVAHARLARAMTGDDIKELMATFLEQIDNFKGKLDILVNLVSQLSDALDLYLFNTEGLIKNAKDMIRYALSSKFDGTTLSKANYIRSYAQSLTKLEGTHWLVSKVKAGLDKFKYSKVVGGLASLWSLVSDAFSFYRDVSRLNTIRESLPNPCPDDQGRRDQLYSDITTSIRVGLVYQTSVIANDLIALGVAIASIAGAIPTAGASTLGIVESLIQMGLSLLAKKIYDDTMAENLTYYALEKRELRCHKAKKKDDKRKCSNGNCGDTGDGGGGGGGGSEGILDPSGYVYEGVPENRLEGVTATVFFRSVTKNLWGDDVETVNVWDAENYDQVNPQITDENGEYGWMVPSGMWQVKYEKPGYHTEYSDWLPVPPPQLDVNQAMTQYSEPVVSSVTATPKAVQIGFDKFMMADSLNTSTILVSQGGKQVPGTVAIQIADSTSALVVNSVRFLPATQLPAGQTLTLTVSRNVTSYAGVQMSQDFTQDFDIVASVESLVSDSALHVLYDQTSPLTIQALPAAVAAGKKVNVKMLGDMIATADATQLTLNNEGKATLNITGEAHGTTAVVFSMQDDSDVQTVTVLNVKDETDFICPMPVTNYQPEQAYEEGIQIALTCELPEAVIYYTLDGTCPCNSPTAQLYVVPITFEGGSMTLKAYATAPGYMDSDIAEYNFYPTGIRNLSESPDDGLTSSSKFKVQSSKSYNLSGQRLNNTDHLRKGVYIINGRKVIVR